MTVRHPQLHRSTTNPASQPQIPTPTPLPRITIQESFLLVVAEIRSGAHAAEDIWLSVYLDGSDSVHGRVRVSEGEGGEVELTARDGVEVVKLSNVRGFFYVVLRELMDGIGGQTELQVACPALKVLPTTTHFPLATPFALRGGIDAIAVSADKGRWVAGGKDGAVRVGDVGGDRKVLDLKGHVADVRAAAFVSSFSRRGATAIRWLNSFEVAVPVWRGRPDRELGQIGRAHV